jgi:hypothetical protein
MRVVTMTCDRCGARIGGPMSTLAVSGTLADTIERIDLCGPYSARLLEWLRALSAPGQGWELSPLLMDREPFHP